MKTINVKNLVMSDLGTSEKIEISDNFSAQELTEEIRAGEIHGEIKLTRLEETILVEGSFSAKIETICNRCLEPVSEVVEAEFDREYQIDRKKESEEDLYVDKYLNIDIKEPIREEIILAIPTQNVCREECKGICSGCGHNLNHEECMCKI